MGRSRGDSGTNTALNACLEELGWAPLTLARQLNRLFGPGTISLSAPYHWVRDGTVPRPPLPALTAHVLSLHLARPITTAQLWQGRAQDSPLLVPAHQGMDLSWSQEGTLRALEDWLLGGFMDHRTFLAVSGTALVEVAGAYIAQRPARRQSARGDDQLEATLVQQYEASIPVLWQLDDRHGGDRVLPFVNAQLQTVALTLREGGHRGRASKRLFRVAALLGQHAGWAAFDAGKHGLAQRYFTTALRAAHQAADKALGAHILADLAYQAASRDMPTDADLLAEVAMRACAGTTARVQASVASRAAFAHAVAGDTNGFDQASEAARLQLATTAQPDPDNDWAYYLTPGHVDALSGAGMVKLARAAQTQGHRRQARMLLARSLPLLAGNAAGFDLDHPHQRLAAVEGAWLSLAHLLHGELEQACDIGHRTLDRLATVRSARCIDVLNQLRSGVRSGRMNNPHVRSFAPRLDRVLDGRAA